MLSRLTGILSMVHEKVITILRMYVPQVFDISACVIFLITCISVQGPEFAVMRYSGSSDVSAALQPVNGRWNLEMS